MPFATAIPTPARIRRVLVVEDDAVNGAVLRMALEKWGFAIIPASDVATAQQAVTCRGPGYFDGVVTDYWLPDLTGLDLVRWLKREDPSLASIILTNDPSRELITDSLRLGVVDFLEKPVNVQKLLKALDKAANQTHRQRHLRQSESAIKNLGRIQHWMIRSVETQLIELCFFPKCEAGGDFLERFQISPDCFCCLLTDVSGHDPQAAYISSYFHGIFRGMSLQAAPLTDIFSYFNGFLVNEWNQAEKLRNANFNSTSVAATALLVNQRQKTVSVVLCGAAAPVQVSSDGRATGMGINSSPPLGWFSDVEIRTVRYSIGGGGTIYLWTDGLIDLAEAQGVHPLCLAFALLEAGTEAAQLPILKLANDDILFAAVQLPEDDLEVGLLQPILLEEYAGDEAGKIDELCAGWRRNFRMAVPALSEAAEHDLLLAAREAMLNALQHGCQGKSDKTVRFQVSYHRLHHYFRVWVEDPGAGHNFDAAAHADELSRELIDEHRGLICIHQLARHVKFERRGATIIMDFPI
jgi:CheY-like chemotaxis protein/anti-sigma regulatory factor (Ser/Thr protein kinase)